MRTSDCQRELIPSVWPAEGMISVLAGGRVLVAGETGVTRVTETGTFTVVTPLLRIDPKLLVRVTITVPVCVPLSSVVGSAVTVRSIPSGGRMPLAGLT